MTNNQKEAKKWFLALRNNLVNSLEKIEGKSLTFKNWDHAGSGGGIMASLKGNIIEKGGVNISTVSGEFSEKMRSRIPGAEKNPNYWATG